MEMGEQVQLMDHPGDLAETYKIVKHPVEIFDEAVIPEITSDLDLRKILKDVFKNTIQHAMFVVRKNADIRYFDDGICHVIISGTGEHKYLVTHDSQGNTKVRRFYGCSLFKPLTLKREEIEVEMVDEKELEQKLFPKIQKRVTKDEWGKCKQLSLLLTNYMEEHVTKSIRERLEVDYFDDSDNLHTIKSEKNGCILLATYDRHGKPQVLYFLGEEFSLAPVLDEFIYQIKEINKRTIGKVIVAMCGNEGMKDDPNTAYIRSTLQRMITETEKMPPKDKKILQNAKVEICDRNFNVLKIISGDGNNKFVLSENENNQLQLTKIPHRVSCCVL